MGFCMWACASRVAKKASAPGAAALCATAALTSFSGAQPRSSPAPGGLACRCTADDPYIIPAGAEAVCRGTARGSTRLTALSLSKGRARGCPPACNRVVPRPCVVHVRGSVSQRQPQTSLRLPPGVCATVFVGAHGCAPAQVTDSPGHGAPCPYHSCGGALRRYAEGQHASYPAQRSQTARKTCKLQPERLTRRGSIRTLESASGGRGKRFGRTQARRQLTNRLAERRLTPPRPPGRRTQRSRPAPCRPSS